MPLAALSFNSIQFTDVSVKMLQMPCCLIPQTPCHAPNFAPVCCAYCVSDSFWFRNAASIKHSIVYRFLASEGYKTTLRFSILRYDMTPNLANIMQFADVASYCCKVLCDGKVLRNELMLHNTMQCTGTSCKMVQMPSNFAQIPRSLEILTLNDQNIVHPMHLDRGMLICRDAFTRGCFYAEVLSQRPAFTHTNTFTHTDLHIQMLLPRVALYKTFTNRYFYTEMHRHTKTFIHRHAVTSTQMPPHSDAFA